MTVTAPTGDHPNLGALDLARIRLVTKLRNRFDQVIHA